MTPDAETSELSPWPHRWAWPLCCATWPLIWIGGLITTTDAGMAVPDWPGTYGYNLWLYPWSTWFFGPWDLFVEHGHRLFASGVGLLTIGLVAVVFRYDRRGWLRWLALAALALVVWQGVLGGLRVILNERLLAMAHGATGPLFFALTAALVVLTGRTTAARPVLGRWWLFPGLVYFQVVAGAALRHPPEASSFNTFALHTQAHVWGAVAVTLTVAGVTLHSWRQSVGRGRKGLAGLMVAVVGVQVLLGVATWFAKYRLPDWAQTGVVATAWETAAGAGTMTPPTAGGWTETLIVTGHSATGSLLLALATGYAFLASSKVRVAEPLQIPSHHDEARRLATGPA